MVQINQKYVEDLIKSKGIFSYTVGHDFESDKLSLEFKLLCNYQQNDVLESVYSLKLCDVDDPIPYILEYESEILNELKMDLRGKISERMCWRIWEILQS